MTEIERDSEKLRPRAQRWTVIARQIAAAAKRRNVVPDFSPLLPVIEQHLLADFVKAYRRGINQANKAVVGVKRKAFWNKPGDSFAEDDSYKPKDKERNLAAFGAGTGLVVAFVKETALSVVNWFRRQWRKSAGLAPRSPAIAPMLLSVGSPVPPALPTGPGGKPTVVPTQIELPVEAPMSIVYDSLHSLNQRAVYEWARQESIQRLWWEVEENDGEPDERVCPICLPLNGVIVEIGQPFGYRKDGHPIFLPVEDTHEKCRCKIHPVIA